MRLALLLTMLLALQNAHSLWAAPTSDILMYEGHLVISKKKFEITGIQPYSGPISITIDVDEPNSTKPDEDNDPFSDWKEEFESHLGSVENSDPGKELVAHLSLSLDARLSNPPKGINPYIPLGAIDIDIHIPIAPSKTESETAAAEHGARVELLRELIKFEESAYDLSTLPDHFIITRAEAVPGASQKINEIFNS